MLNNDSSFDEEVTRTLKRYEINNVQISSYNSRVNEIVKRRHRDLRKTLLKLVENNATK